MTVKNLRKNLQNKEVVSKVEFVCFFETLEMKRCVVFCLNTKDLLYLRNRCISQCN